MIICLLYLIGWEGLVPNMPGTMYYLSIFSHLQAVAQHPVRADAEGWSAFLAGDDGDEHAFCRKASCGSGPHPHSARNGCGCGLVVYAFRVRSPR